ncbi:MAG: 3-deoxy-7-phosphoheptulonate synthase [Proteobacteria bacterium]|nr:3-deoxy-7-phosphoheptulonate synthase [Pseudomonadota bacterium]
MNHSQKWHPSQWRQFPARQQPEYPNPEALSAIEKQIATYPPLVAVEDIQALSTHLKLAEQGKAFILHAGDCAERFQDCDLATTNKKYLHLHVMATLLELQLAKPVTIIGRLAGQFAKPRSVNFSRVHYQETRETLPVFRGDNVHSFQHSHQDRQPDPSRLVTGYYKAKQVLHDLNTLSSYYSYEVFLTELLLQIKSLPQKQQHELLLLYQEKINLPEAPRPLYTSHEALLLGYEEALTKPWHHGEEQVYYNLSSHFLWLGHRTRYFGEAHMNYISGIANPVGIKIGPETTPEELATYLQRLNPEKISGKLTLITRMGSQAVVKQLTLLIPVVKRMDIPVLWLCDPMHGHATILASGQKTRFVPDMKREVALTHQLLQKHSCALGGIHLETTHEAVSECLDEQCVPLPQSLSPYTSFCDPRLTFSQAMTVIRDLV